MSENIGYQNTSYGSYSVADYRNVCAYGPGNNCVNAMPPRRPDPPYCGNPGTAWPQSPPCCFLCCTCRGFYMEPHCRPFPVRHDDNRRDREERGAIIPYASGPARSLTFNAGTQLSTGVAVAFGSSVPGIPVTGSAIDISSLENMSFSMPRNGTVTSIAAFFSASAPVTLGTSITINAQLYASDTPDNNFTPLGSAITLTPSLTGLVTSGSVANAVDKTQCLNICAGTRLLLVFFALSQTVIETATTIAGYFSGGLQIK